MTRSVLRAARTGIRWREGANDALHARYQHRQPLSEEASVVARRVVAVPISALCISAITQGELLFGLARRPGDTALHEVVRELLRRVDDLPWDTATAEVYGPARAATRREGRVLPPVDLLIGSHA